MDPALMALCGEMLGDGIDSERFAMLLIETGIMPEGLEWEVANRLLSQRDSIDSLSKRFGNTLH